MLRVYHAKDEAVAWASCGAPGPGSLLRAASYRWKSGKRQLRSCIGCGLDIWSGSQRRCARQVVTWQAYVDQLDHRHIRHQCSEAGGSRTSAEVEGYRPSRQQAAGSSQQQLAAAASSSQQQPAATSSQRSAARPPASTEQPANEQPANSQLTVS